MKRGIKLFFLFCLSGMMCISLLPSTIYAQEEDTQTVDEESSDSSELPKSSNMAPVYHFSSESFCQGGAWIFFILLTQILSLLLPE